MINLSRLVGFLTSPCLRLFHVLHQELRASEHIYMVLLALVVGLLCGLGAAAFRLWIHVINVLAWSAPWTAWEYDLALIRNLPGLWVLLTPAVGGLMVGLFTRYCAPESAGHGVPEVIASVALHEGRILPRTVITRAMASGVCIGSGGSVGREGPIVQIGAALGSTVGQLLNLSGHRLRTLAGCGAAAGIAAAFNTPIAGALFALEIVLGEFGVLHFSPIVISSVMATVVSRAVFGDEPAFSVPAYNLAHPMELLPYAGLGLVAGLVARAFTALLYGSEDAWSRLPLPAFIRPMLGGLVIGLIALGFPEILGNGYQGTSAALTGQLGLWMLLALLVLKMMAVATTLGSGGSGGVFAPSLFLGAMAGGAVGRIVATLFPHSGVEPGAYALVGMGAVVAAAMHAPITAILIIFEMTHDYKIILPLMISCILGTLLATRLHSASIYTMQLLRRGVDIHSGRDSNVLRQLSVRDVLRPAPQVVTAATPLVELVTRVMELDHGVLYVVGEDGRLCGAITLRDIRPVLADTRVLEGLIVAADIAQQTFPVVTPDANLDTVMKQLEQNYAESVAVVEEGRLIGTVRLLDVIQRYNSEMLKRDMVYGVSSSIRVARQTRQAARVAGFQLVEIEAPGPFHGRSLAELDVRRQYGVIVLMVRRKDPSGIDLLETVPFAHYVVAPGDVFLVMGEQEHVERLRTL